MSAGCISSLWPGSQLDVPSCTAAGTNNGCRPNPTYGNDSQYSSLADSHYDGLHVSFVERPVQWGSYRISYTYSKALDNVGEFFFSAPINNFNIWQDYGRSDDDQRNRLVFDSSIHSPLGAAKSAWEQFCFMVFNSPRCFSIIRRCRSPSLPAPLRFRAPRRAPLSMESLSIATPDRVLIFSI